MLWGTVLNGFMNIAFIISTKYLDASEVSFFMLLEFSLGPIWVWLGVGETPTFFTLVGGSLVFLSVSILTFSELKCGNMRIEKPYLLSLPPIANLRPQFP